MSHNSEPVDGSPGGPRLLTLEEAAAYLGVRPKWLAEVVRARGIRCVRLGRKVRFRTEYLEEFVAANEQPLTSPPPPGRPLRSVPAPRSGRARSRL